MTSRSSAALRSSLALPEAFVQALWTISRLAGFMTRSSPAMNTTDAAEQAKPSQTVRTLAGWFFRLLQIASPSATSPP